MVQLRSGQGQGVPHHQEPDPEPPRLPTSSLLALLSAEDSQEFEEEIESSTETETSNQLGRRSNQDSKYYHIETPTFSLPNPACSTPRPEHTSLAPGIPKNAFSDLAVRGRQINREQVSRRPSYQGVSSMTENSGLTESRCPGQALRDMKKRFAKLKEEKELALWSRKLADTEVEKAAGLFTSRNSEIETEKETIAQKIHCESKLALLVLEVYS